MRAVCSGRRREPKVGTLRTHRFISAAVLAAVCICPQVAAASRPSPSSTLLSGYGGPGQGNQAILGSTLIGGAGGKGGGKSKGGGPPGPSAAAAITSIALPQAAPSSSHRRAGQVPTKRSATRHASETPAPAYVRGTPASDRAAGGTLGLTGADLLYGVLALGALALTALLTVRLARRSGRAQGTQ
jgi:hypothetical protein